MVAGDGRILEWEINGLQASEKIVTFPFIAKKLLNAFIIFRNYDLDFR